jgi:hypothetical protein
MPRTKEVRVQIDFILKLDYAEARSTRSRPGVSSRVALLLIACFSTAKAQTANPPAYPPQFLWGAAMSAHQSEGITGGGQFADWYGLAAIEYDQNLARVPRGSASVYQSEITARRPSGQP